ncbi:MAG: UDP-N-acetylmuramate dehydrogenase [Actinobacteria bacterium]|nr:UDP-N-acetylmuramate dehydrogenase [Actinomycetota bacterium]
MNTLAARQREALRRLGSMAAAQVPLAQYTTYKLGGSAAVFVAPRNDDDLCVLAEVARDTDLPTLVIGRGSNLLIADGGFAGITITLSEMAEWVRFEAEGVAVCAAMALPVLARRCVSAGLVGFEWAVGVPGAVGGAVRMNAGGHGSDMAASVIGVHLLDLRTTRRGWVDASDLGLRFRGSRIGDHQVVLDARLRLRKGDAVAAEKELAEIVRWRRDHQPGGQNAGSVFVNPIPGELAAAELIDKLGLRGFRIGGAVVSEKHANFIQAEHTCSAADVRAVMEHVRAEVESKLGIVLRSEVRLVGFEDTEAATGMSAEDAELTI